MLGFLLCIGQRGCQTGVGCCLMIPRAFCIVWGLPSRGWAAEALYIDVVSDFWKVLDASCREHGAEAVAAVCLIILALKAALAAHLDTRLRIFLDGMDDMQVAFSIGGRLCVDTKLCNWGGGIAAPCLGEARRLKSRWSVPGALAFRRRT